MKKTLPLGPLLLTVGFLSVSLFSSPNIAVASEWGGGGYGSCIGCKVDTNQTETTQAMLAVLVPGTQIPKSVQQSLENIREQLTYQEIAAAYLRRVESQAK